MRFYNHPKLAFYMAMTAAGTYQPSTAARAAEYHGPLPWHKVKLTDEHGEGDVYICPNGKLVTYFDRHCLYITTRATEVIGVGFTNKRTPPQAATLFTTAMDSFK